MLRGVTIKLYTVIGCLVRPRLFVTLGVNLVCFRFMAWSVGTVLCEPPKYLIHILCKSLTRTSIQKYKGTQDGVGLYSCTLRSPPPPGNILATLALRDRAWASEVHIRVGETWFSEERIHFMTPCTQSGARTHEVHDGHPCLCSFGTPWFPVRGRHWIGSLMRELGKRRRGGGGVQLDLWKGILNAITTSVCEKLGQKHSCEVNETWSLGFFTPHS